MEFVEYSNTINLIWNWSQRCLILWIKQNSISLSKQILEQINTHVLKDNQPNIVPRRIRMVT